MDKLCSRLLHAGFYESLLAMRSKFIITWSNMDFFTPISPKSDQNLFSPYNINTLSKEKVRRINKMITSGKMF